MAALAKTAALLDLARPLTREEFALASSDDPKTQAWLAEAVKTIDVERTIEGASTLTVDLVDPEWWLIRQSGFLSKSRLAADLRVDVDGIDFTLEELEKTDDGEQLVLYESVVARLKALKAPRKASRDAMTRAQFAHRLVREAGFTFVSPDKNVPQPIADLPAEDVKTLRKTRVERRRFKPERELGRVTPSSWASSLLQRMDFPDNPQNRRAIVAWIKAEGGAGPQFHTAGNTADYNPLNTTQTMPGARSVNSHGVKAYTSWDQGLQATVKTLRLDFYSVIRAALRRGKSAREVAEAVEKTPWGTGGGVLSALQSVSGKDDGGAVVGTPDRAFVRRFEFRVDRGESYWDTLQRLAEEVGWRCFVTGGRVFFVSDYTLIRQAPSMTLREGENGVDKIRWLITRRRKIDNLEVVCRLTAWAAPPGSVVNVEGEGDLADGPWLVRSISRKMLDASGTATVTLGQPVAPRPEPASSVETIEGTESSSADVDAPERVRKAYRKAVQIDKKNYPYAWGGGHSNFNGPYDCSGFVSALLHAGGMLDTPLATGGLIQWGEKGKGKHLTVWVRETGNPHLSHTFVTFNVGNGREIFEAGGTHGAPTGRRESRSFSGFEPRHYKGT